MITLRPATMADAEMLLRWRNDPLTCAMSITTEAVQLEGHLVWMDRILKDPLVKLMVAEVDGQPVGTVRTVIEDAGAGPSKELSWTVAPEHRGKGVGKAMVMAALTEGQTIATIKRENSASQAIARASGFRYQSGDHYQRWAT